MRATQPVAASELLNFCSAGTSPASGLCFCLSRCPLLHLTFFLFKLKTEGNRGDISKAADEMKAQKDVKSQVTGRKGAAERWLRMLEIAAQQRPAANAS
jgi:hypothetical protein